MSASATEQSNVSSKEQPLGWWWRFVSESNTWLLIAAVFIGAVTALANVAFHWAIDRSQDFFWVDLGRYIGIEGLRHYDVFEQGLGALPENWWFIPAIPMAGMAILVLLDRWFPGEIKGYGLPRFLEIVNVKGGYLRRRWITLKTLSTAITLGSGMSAGVEGPIAQIGGSIGSTVGRLLRPSFDRLRVLIACGSASAIAATFNSPIAGVMFAEEIVLIGEFEAQSFYLIVLAAGASSVVSQYLKADHLLISAPAFQFPLNHELLFLLVMGLLSGLLAVLFTKSFYAMRDRLEASAIPKTVLPLLGGLAMGVALILFPQIASNGYETINATLSGELSLQLLLVLVLAKILMTGVTLGCGGAGGVFAPAMFIGAVFGGGFAEFVNVLSPGTIAEPGAFAMIGMGAFLSAATHAPMTAIFLLFELTRDYNAVVPAMITSVSAILVARRLLPDSIDSYDLSRRGLDIHAGSEANILRKLYVRGLVTRDFQSIPESMALPDFVRYVTNSHHVHFPVVNREGEMVGIVSMQDLRDLLLDRDVWPYVVVGELARRDVLSVKGSDTLFDAMKRISSLGIEEIPVVDEDDPSRVVGMLKRSDLQNFYQKRLLARELSG